MQGNDRDLASSTAASELAVTEKSLNENPKSYSAWHHRMWIIKKGFSSPKDEIKQMNRSTLIFPTLARILNPANL